jgi:hypothetical protein
MDTVVYQLDELKWCFSLMGAGQMLLGTDYPWYLAQAAPR